MAYKDRNQKKIDNKKRKKEYNLRNKTYSLEQKALRGFCEYCGLVYDASASHNFHWAHKDQDDKFDTISNLVARGRNFLVLVKEISKCRLLCANCHMEETHSNKHYLHQNAGNGILVDRNPNQLELDL